MAAATATVFVSIAAPAGATSPSDVQVEVETSLLGDPSPFVASGAAIDEGLVCGEGVVVDDSGKVTGVSPTGFNFQGVKRFTCADGSGEFFVNVQARIDFRRGVIFNRNVLRGTDDYVKLHGAGSGIGLGGVPCGDPNLCILDIFDGRLDLD